MDKIDPETAYSDTFAVSLEEELSPFTASNTSRRTPLSSELDNEQSALETNSQRLADIMKAFKKLPTCSPQEQPLEKLLMSGRGITGYWGGVSGSWSNGSKQYSVGERSVKVIGKKHSRNEFLYRMRNTKYPVLSAIVTAFERIDSKRNSDQSGVSSDWSLQY